MKVGNKSNFLGTKKITDLLFNQSYPAVIGLLVLSLYNLVDTIFIGHGVGSLGIAGLTISFPLQMIFIAFSQALGIGAASIISRALGSNQIKKAEQALLNCFSLILISSFAITGLVMVFMEPLLKLFGSTPEILPYAMEYMNIIILSTVFIVFISALLHVIRAQGHAKFAMVAMIVGIGINIILDPIFIFWFDMGIGGAALATVIGHIVASLLVLYYFVSKKSLIKVRLEKFVFDWKIVKEIFSIGSSSFARLVSANIIFIVVNNSLALYGGVIAIAAFGIVNRVIMMILMPVFGIVQGMQPIVGYNFGSKKYKRVKEVISLGIKVTTGLCILAFIILYGFADFIAGVFTTETELVEMTIPALRIIVLMLPIIGYQVVAAGVYQSMGKAKSAFFISILRQVVILIPLLLILPMFFQLQGIWYAFPIADLLSGIVIAYILYLENKKLRKMI